MNEKEYMKNGPIEVQFLESNPSVSKTVPASVTPAAADPSLPTPNASAAALSGVLASNLETFAADAAGAAQPEADASPSFAAQEKSSAGKEESGFTAPAAGSVPSGSTASAPTSVQTAPPKRKKGWMKAIALGLCCILLGGAAGAGAALYTLGSRFPDADSVPTKMPTMMEGVRESAVIDVKQIDTSAELTPTQVYAANVNSTVGIRTTVTTNYWGFQTTAAAAGSGFILTDDGYILTNYHVVSDSTSITVTTYSGDDYDAILVGYDEDNDIAVLKISADGLVPVVLGDSKKMHVGDSVIAIGNPLGELTFSLTSGAISALDREITLSNGVTMDLIQTDCAINSGNSGGALFNMYGEVIGITNAKYSSYGSQTSVDNIGFAIPIDKVSGIMKSVMENGVVAKPYIGVTVSAVSEELQSYGLPEGAAIQSVVPDGPADKVGLQQNDIVTKANNTVITSDDDLVDAVQSMVPGDAMRLEVFRQGQTLSFDLIVGERIQSAVENRTPSEDQSEQTPWGSWGGWSIPFFQDGESRPRETYPSSNNQGRPSSNS